MVSKKVTLLKHERLKRNPRGPLVGCNGPGGTFAVPRSPGVSPRRSDSAEGGQAMRQYQDVLLHYILLYYMIVSHVTGYDIGSILHLVNSPMVWKCMYSWLYQVGVSLCYPRTFRLTGPLSYCANASQKCVLTAPTLLFQHW